MSKFLDETGVEHLSQQIKTYVDDAIAAVASAGSGPKLKSILINPNMLSYALPANTSKKVLLKTATYPDDRNAVSVSTTGTSSITIDGLTYNADRYGHCYLPFDLVMTIETPTQAAIEAVGNAFMFEVE